MKTVNKALKDHFSDSGALLVLLSGIEAVSRMMAAESQGGQLDHVVAGDAALLLAELSNVVRSIVEDTL